MENKEKNPTQIVYVKGDATEPMGDGKKVIVHCCNNIGAWGSGFVMAVSRKWKEPEAVYRAKLDYKLGSFDLVRVNDDIEVCNLIGQTGIQSFEDVHDLPPVRYVAIENGLNNLAFTINDSSENISVHMPKIGSDRAGGNWEIIEKIIEVTLCKAGIPVTVYLFD